MNAASRLSACRDACSAAGVSPGQYPAGMHQRDPVAAGGFVHEVGR